MAATTERPCGSLALLTVLFLRLVRIISLSRPCRLGKIPIRVTPPVKCQLFIFHVAAF